MRASPKSLERSSSFWIEVGLGSARRDESGFPALRDGCHVIGVGPGREPERGAGRAREAHDHDGIERTEGVPGHPRFQRRSTTLPDPFPGQAGRRHVPAVATFEEEKGMRRGLERVRERPRRSGGVRP
jgi:hypothetical protein